MERKYFTLGMIYCGGLVFFAAIGVLEMAGISRTSELIADFYYKAAWFGIKGFSLATIMLLWGFGGLIGLIAYSVYKEGL